MIPAAIPEFRAVMNTTPFEEALLQCLCVVGIQLGLLVVWRARFTKLYLACAIAAIAAANFTTAYLLLYDDRRVLPWLYAVRLISGFASSYPIHCTPKWINQMTPSHKTIAKQANVQLTGVFGTVTGYMLVFSLPIWTKKILYTTFLIAGILVALICTIGLLATRSDEYERTDEEYNDVAVIEASPKDDDLWYDLSSFMTPVGPSFQPIYRGSILAWFEFICITCAIGINSCACQALSFWILTFYISSMKLPKSSALTGITMIFGAGTVTGLALSGVITRYDTKGKPAKMFSRRKMLQLRLAWMTVFCFFTGASGMYCYLYGDEGFWNLTIALTISVLFGAAAMPLAQSAVGSCAKQFEDVAYGVYQTVFQSSWFFGPLLPVLIGKLSDSAAENAGVKGVMLIPSLAFLFALMAYCHSQCTQNVIKEDSVELSSIPSSRV